MSIPIKVLLVDDSEDDRYFFERALRRTEVNTKLFIAEDGDAAIAYLEGSAKPRDDHPSVDVMFLDLKMPGRNGFDVLRWVKQRPATALKIVILSGSQQPADIKLAKELGAHGYLVKPATAERLKEFLQSPSEA